MQFLNGLIKEVKDIDLEQLHEEGKAWNIEHSLLKKGELKSSIKVIFSLNMQLTFSTTSLPLLQRGSFPKETILILFFHKGHEGAVFLDKKVMDYEIMIVEEGQDLELISAQAMEIFSLSISKQLFYKEFELYFHATLANFMKEQKIVLKKEKYKELDSFLFSLLFNDKNIKLIELLKENCHFIEQQILYKIFESINFISYKQKNKKFDARKIKIRLDNEFQHNIKMENLSKELGISRRLLFSSFKEYYGCTPNQYLWSLRLNKAHEILTSMTENEKKISEIAMECGFSHMSHFAREYKTMYKKLPSKSKQNLHFNAKEKK